MTLNPDLYAIRLLEAQAEKASWHTVLPVFFYNQVMFPGQILHLHLFEPRYKVSCIVPVHISVQFTLLITPSLYVFTTWAVVLLVDDATGCLQLEEVCLCVRLSASLAYGEHCINRQCPRSGILCRYLILHAYNDMLIE